MSFVQNTVADGQKRDCTIRAIATLCDVPYQTAELSLAIAGKNDNQGFNIYDWIDQHHGHILGCKFTLVRKLAPRGRFMIGNKRHVRAYINNISHDSFGGGMSYRYCYQVELNAGADETTRQIDTLKSKGITTLAQWRPTRDSIKSNFLDTI